MKFSCEKALLQSAIAVTSRAVAQKSSIPALEGLLLHADSRLTISGYNLQTGIRTKVSADVTEPGEIVLNARLFGDIIRRMPDDVVVFTADDKQLVHLSCGDADFDILGLSAADYPELPMVEDDFSVSIQQKLLRAMIEETAFAVSTNESRPIHTGALFEITDQGLTMVAVDGFRLAIRREPLEKIDGGAFSFVAPGSALGEVKNICSDVEDLAAVTAGWGTTLFVWDSRIANKPVALDCMGSTVYLNSGVTGENNTVAIRCGTGYGSFGGIVFKGGSTIAGAEQTAYGGQIFD